MIPDWVRLGKVGNHCHVKGKHREATHLKSNTKTSQSFFVYLPFALHNLSHCDAPLSITEIIKQKNTGCKYEFNAESDERYASLIS